MRDFKVYYGIPTYTQWNRARDAILTIMATSSIKPDEFVIIDNSENGSAVTALKSLTDMYANVHIIPRTKNILAGAWNDIMELYCDDYIIIANDDVIPHKDSIGSLIATAKNNPDAAIINGSASSGNSYSLFLLRKWAYAKIGKFDEMLIPAYFEDNDYDYRRALAGLERITDPNATFSHYGSATMKSLDPVKLSKHHIRFGNNRDYYIRKWGGEPGNERFKTPFQEIRQLEDD